MLFAGGTGSAPHASTNSRPRRVSISGARATAPWRIASTGRWAGGATPDVATPTATTSGITPRLLCARSGHARQLAAISRRNRLPVGAFARVPEERADAGGHLGIDDVLHAARDILDLGLREVHRGGEQHLGEAAASHQVAGLDPPALR